MITGKDKKAYEEMAKRGRAAAEECQELKKENKKLKKIYRYIKKIIRNG